MTLARKSSPQVLLAYASLAASEPYKPANVSHTAQTMCFLRLQVVIAWNMCVAEHHPAIWHDPRRGEPALRLSNLP